MKIKPNQINMTQIMKKCTYYLFVTLLVLTGLFISPTTVLAQIPEPKCACAYCGVPCDTTSGHKPDCPYYVPPDQGRGGGAYIPAPVNPGVDYNSEFTNFLTDEANAENSKGIDCYNKREWSKAIRHFKRAAKYRPDIAAYKTNIDNAVAQQERLKEYERRAREWKKAAAENERKAKEAIGALKKGTIKAIKDLNCSAYWSLQSAGAALAAKDEVTKELDDEWASARKYGQFSDEAMEGKSPSGCPEVKISVPDVPPPVEANPQVRLYNYIITETKKLVPAIIETQQEIKDVNQRIEKTNKELADTRIKSGQLDEKLETTKSEKEKVVLIAEKKETDIKGDVLADLAGELLEEAADLNKKADQQIEREADLQNLYDDLRANPERAQELADKEAAKRASEK